MKKSREGEHPRPDVTRGSIEYFMLKPKARAPHYLQPGEIVGVKVGSPTRNCPSTECLAMQLADIF